MLSAALDLTEVQRCISELEAKLKDAVSMEVSADQSSNAADQPEHTASGRRVPNLQACIRLANGRLRMLEELSRLRGQSPSRAEYMSKLSQKIDSEQTTVQAPESWWINSAAIQCDCTVTMLPILMMSVHMSIHMSVYMHVYGHAYAYA